MRILVLGGDIFGAHLAASLASENHNITVVDTSIERLNALPIGPNLEGVLASESLMEDLRSIDMNEVDAFLALSDDDNKNVAAAQIASHIFHVRDVVCRIGDPQREKAYRDMGINVVCPTLMLEETIKRGLKGNN